MRAFRIRTTLLALLVVALWPHRLRSEETAAATTHAQFAAICAAIKSSAGATCGGRARHDQTNTPAMSSAVPAPPKLNEAPSLPARPLDGWGNAVRISIDGQGVKLESAGADGEFGGADDLAQRCPAN